MSLINIVTHFFEQESWPFVRLPGKSVLALVFSGEACNWDCIAKVSEDQENFIFYSLFPVFASEKERPAIAEFITRANYGIIVGNFELDYTDGEIRYKTSIDFEGSSLDKALIKQLVYTNVLTMAHYLPGILAVLEQKMNPEQAIHMVEEGDSNNSLPSDKDPTGRLV